ncbi:MAG: hypothetical protein LDL41_04510 [Coleofasciculus sp. S288]|nr:hypothetical protein [Coleofasciculus sp. S288]
MVFGKSPPLAIALLNLPKGSWRVVRYEIRFGFGDRNKGSFSVFLISDRLMSN